MPNNCNLDEECKKILEVHPNLHVEGAGESSCVIQGTLSSASIKGQNITYSFDEVNVKIVVENFPNTLPKCFETSSLNTDFHINPDKSLCLDTPFTLWQHFSNDSCLLTFINKFLVPYFLQYKHYKKFGSLPFGDRKHGGTGNIEQYNELFQTTGYRTISLLIYGLKNIYRGHHICPCGSNIRLRKCHGSILRKSFSNYSTENHLDDIANICALLPAKDKNEINEIDFATLRKSSVKKRIIYTKKIHLKLINWLKLGYW
jgi:hypothetical protein